MSMSVSMSTRDGYEHELVPKDALFVILSLPSYTYTLSLSGYAMLLGCWWRRLVIGRPRDGDGNGLWEKGFVALYDVFLSCDWLSQRSGGFLPSWCMSCPVSQMMGWFY